GYSPPCSATDCQRPRASNGGGTPMTTDTPAIMAVFAERDPNSRAKPRCLGFIFNRGREGFEALGSDPNPSLGMFASAYEAAEAIRKTARKIPPAEPTKTQRAKEAIAAHPRRSDAELADDIGVSETTVNRARKEMR